MSERESDDDLQIDIEDMREPAAPDGARSAERSLSHPARTPHRRLARRAAAMVALALVVVVALGGVPAVREGAAGLLSPLLPAPSPTLAPGANRFYFVPSPPGVDVVLDGHVLARQPLAGDPHPLVLSRGRHTLTWRSSRLPFQPLACVVSVPANPSADTCPLAPAQPGQPGQPGQPAGVSASGTTGYVITLHPSLGKASDPLVANTLQKQGSGLLLAVWDALAAVQFTGVVQTGEYYALDAPSPHVVTATEPLRATLTYAPNSLFPEPCTVASGILPCRFPDQDCSLLCTVPGPLAASVGSPGDWIVGTGVHTAWTYATQDGRVVARNVSDPLGVRLVLLRIAWDGMRWHITPIVGHNTALPATDDAACDSALILLAGTTWSFMVSGPPPGASLAVASGTSPADGCVVVVVNYGTPPPIFLERFGVLLAVDDQAVNAQDALPMADGAEQRLARELMSSLHL